MADYGTYSANIWLGSSSARKIDTKVRVSVEYESDQITESGDAPSKLGPESDREGKSGLDNISLSLSSSEMSLSTEKSHVFQVGQVPDSCPKAGEPSDPAIEGRIEIATSSNLTPSSEPKGGDMRSHGPDMTGEVLGSCNSSQSLAVSGSASWSNAPSEIPPQSNQHASSAVSGSLVKVETMIPRIEVAESESRINDVKNNSIFNHSDSLGSSLKNHNEVVAPAITAHESLETQTPDAEQRIEGTMVHLDKTETLDSESRKFFHHSNNGLETEESEVVASTDHLNLRQQVSRGAQRLASKADKTYDGFLSDIFPNFFQIFTAFSRETWSKIDAKNFQSMRECLDNQIIAGDMMASFLNRSGDSGQSCNMEMLDDSKILLYKVKAKHREEVSSIIDDVCECDDQWKNLNHCDGLGMFDFWNLLWTWEKPTINPEQLLVFQKISRFQDTRQLTRKDLLKKNLQRYANQIMPTTFVLPSEYSDFVSSFYTEANAGEGNANIWIMKPTSMSR